MTRVDPRRRALLGLSLGWLVVVLLVGGVTFVVVSHVGQEVGQASALGTPAVDPTRASGTAGTSTSTTPTPTPSPSSSRTAPTRSATAGPRPSPPPATTGPRPTTPAPTPTVERSTTPPAPPSTRTSSFTTAGGTVVASCTGSTIRLSSITVRDGWRVEEEHDSRKIHVHYERSGATSAETAGSEAGAEDSDHEVELTIRCVGGAPTRVEN